MDWRCNLPCLADENLVTKRLVRGHPGQNRGDQDVKRSIWTILRIDEVLERETRYRGSTASFAHARRTIEFSTPPETGNAI